MVGQVSSTSSAKIDTIREYLSHIDYHKSTIKVNVDDPLIQPIFEADRDDLPMMVREALLDLVAENIKVSQDVKMITKELADQAKKMVQQYHIVLDTKHIKKMQHFMVSESQPQTFDCIILGVGHREAYIRVVHYECKKGCTRKLDVHGDRKIRDDIKCHDHELLMIPLSDKSEYDFLQRVVIQEQLSDAKNSSPVDYDCRITADMVGDTFVGQKKRVMVMPRTIFNDKRDVKNQAKLYLDVISIADLEEEKRILPSNKEIEEYRIKAEAPDFFDKFVDSFAPNVIGEDLKPVKKILVLALIGANRMDDTRADINVIMVGDPSVAKSSLLKFCQEVAQKNIYTSGKGASAAGLTIGMVKRPDGTSIAQPGVLPLCHNGVALIDELDKMDAHDRSGLHEAMEQQTVSIAKAGIALTLPAQATVIAAANPKYGKWDINMPILENINLPPALMSRFDVKFRILDTPNELIDSRKAAHVLSKFKEEKVTLFSKLQILALINYAKTLKPRLSDEASTALQKFYTNLRKKDTRDIRIDIRQLESLARLATAHAKLHFKDFVDVHDVNAIIDIYKASLKSFDIDIENEGEQTHFAGDRDELNKHDTFWDCFKKSVNSEGTVSKPDVLELMAQTKWFTEESAKKFFDQMARGVNQQLIEGADGRFRRIN